MRPQMAKPTAAPDMVGGCEQVICDLFVSKNGDGFATSG